MDEKDLFCNFNLPATEEKKDNDDEYYMDADYRVKNRLQ